MWGEEANLERREMDAKAEREREREVKADGKRPQVGRGSKAGKKGDEETHQRGFTGKASTPPRLNAQRHNVI